MGRDCYARPNTSFLSKDQIMYEGKYYANKDKISFLEIGEFGRNAHFQDM